MSQFVATLSLSPILPIAPLKRNSEAEAVERQAEELCKALGIFLQNLQDYNTMSAYLFPHTSAERLLAITVFNNLLFYIDEMLDRNNAETPDELERRKMFDLLIHVFMTGELSEDADTLETATLKVRELILPLASRQWLARLIHNTQKHLKATTYDSGLELDKEGDELLQHFIAVREHDSGMVPTVDLIEFANDLSLPDDVLAHPLFEEATLETIRIAALMNDIFSFHREVIIQGSSFNLVAVMMKAYDLPLEAAVERSIDYINENILSFMAKANYLPQYDDEALNEKVRRYYQSLEDQINAAWHWQLSGTNRYRSSESPFQELRTLIKAN